MQENLFGDEEENRLSSGLCESLRPNLCAILPEMPFFVHEKKAEGRKRP
jgi:hypothetical protein